MSKYRSSKIPSSNKKLITKMNLFKEMTPKDISYEKSIKKLKKNQE